MLHYISPLLLIFAFLQELNAQSLDGRNRKIVNKSQLEDPDLAKFALFKQNAPRPKNISPSNTSLPLEINRNARIVYVGNTLLDRSQDFGYLETLLHQVHPNHHLTVRNFAWSADTIDLQPRPANFADTDQHLVFAKADIIFVAFGFNESFEGISGVNNFRKIFNEYISATKAKAFNGNSGPMIILLSPIANENIKGVNAADNNASHRYIA